jgi:hypothetical protein
MVHRLAAEKFTDRGPQNSPAISHTRIGGRAGSFQLELPTFALRVQDLTECNGSAIPKLVGPIPKLMSPITGRKGAHSLQEIVAREDGGKVFFIDGVRIES